MWVRAKPGTQTTTPSEVNGVRNEPHEPKPGDSQSSVARAHYSAKHCLGEAKLTKQHILTSRAKRGEQSEGLEGVAFHHYE